MAYLTRDDVTAFLNITDLSSGAQSSLDGIIAAVEKAADSYCNRSWGEENPQTERFDGGTNTFFPRHIPIGSVTSVSYDGDALSADEIYNYGTHIVTEYIQPYGRRAVEIVYTPDSELPDDVKQALIQWAAQIFKAAEDGGKTTKRVEWGNQVSVEFLTQDGMPKFVEQVLSRYRLHPL